MTTQSEHPIEHLRDLPAGANADPRRTEREPEASPEERRAVRRRDAIRFGGPVVLLVLATKLVVLSWSLVAESVGERRFADVGERLTMWNAWDAQHYLNLATKGYETVGDAANRIVFLPGYPLAVRAVNWILPGDVLSAALVVAGVASITAALLLAYLVRHDTGDDDRAHRAVWFFLIFPTAYFLHVPFTEGLFLTFVLGSFLAARTGHWATAGIVGALAAFTRINGVLLIPALAVEAYLQYRKDGRVDPAFAWIGFIAVGLLIYLGINQYLFGSPLHFQEVQEKIWFKHVQDPITSIRGIIASAEASGPDLKSVVYAEPVFLAIGFAAGLVALFKVRASYGAWVLLNVLLFASTSWIQSTPRYAITLFPIFLLLAGIERTWVFMLVSFISLMTMAWWLTLFSLGRWAF